MAFKISTKDGKIQTQDGKIIPSRDTSETMGGYEDRLNELGFDTTPKDSNSIGFNLRTDAEVNNKNKNQDTSVLENFSNKLNKDLSLAGQQIQNDFGNLAEWYAQNNMLSQLGNALGSALNVTPDNALRDAQGNIVYDDVGNVITPENNPTAYVEGYSQMNLAPDEYGQEVLQFYLDNYGVDGLENFVMNEVGANQNQQNTGGIDLDYWMPKNFRAEIPSWVESTSDNNPEDQRGYVAPLNAGMSGSGMGGSGMGGAGMNVASTNPTNNYNAPLSNNFTNSGVNLNQLYTRDYPIMNNIPDSYGQAFKDANRSYLLANAVNPKYFKNMDLRGYVPLSGLLA